jgi:hypothetical protein
MAITAAFLYLRFGRKAPGQAVDTEKSTFATLQKACRSNHIRQTHSALHAWIAQSSPALSPNSLPVTLSEFAWACDDTQLAAEFEQLQEALISNDSNWQGSELLNSLLRIRRKINQQKAVHLKTHLAPLNP